MNAKFETRHEDMVFSIASLSRENLNTPLTKMAAFAPLFAPWKPLASAAQLSRAAFSSLK
jgi:hypothetical protein